MQWTHSGCANRAAAALAGAAAIVAMMAASAAGAEGTEATPAIVRTADDAALAWGACPEFLPAGCGIAVLHGDPAKPNVDILFRVPAKSEIPAHTHTSPERMVLVAGEMQVAYDGQPAARLRPGSYAYGPAGRAHRATCVSDEPCVLFIAFESPLDAMPAATAGR
jgi:quercetin dioxygenase-like cupin family protein